MTDASHCPDRRLDALALALAPGVGAGAYRDRVATFGSASHALAATLSAAERTALRAEAERMCDDAVRCGARLLLAGDEDFPARLNELYAPPPYLFAVGNLAVLEGRVVAVVGTRRATPYGERATRVLVGALARAGVCIVSGMARGIDAAAHRAALEARAPTVAVLGTGIDVVYPAEHRALHRVIAETGLLLSEFPCGSRAAPASFPRRNRIIAALGRATLIVEAGLKSGAHLTVKAAMALHRDIGAVPGPIDAPQSFRPNDLIREGAQPILCAEDALALAGIPRGTRPSAVPTLRGDEQLVWAALRSGAGDAESVAAAAGLEPHRALAAVTALEIAGLVESSPTGELRAIHAPPP